MEECNNYCHLFYLIYYIMKWNCKETITSASVYKQQNTFSRNVTEHINEMVASAIGKEDS